MDRSFKFSDEISNTWSLWFFYSVLQGIMSENVNNFHWWNDGKLSSRMIEFSHESFVIIKKPTDMIWSLLQLSNIKIINHVEDSRCMLWPATRNKHATESKHHTNLKWRQHSNSNERIQRWLGTRTLNWLSLYGSVKVKPMTINHLKHFVSIWNFFSPSPRITGKLLRQQCSSYHVLVIRCLLFSS